jgi:hypothetical protein
MDLHANDAGNPLNAAIEQPLRPSPGIYKLLISTPAHFVGEYESTFLITHAWPDYGRVSSQFTYDPTSALFRTFLVYAFKPNVDDDTSVKFRIAPNFNWTGDAVCLVLAVLFGKRFDYHGLVESDGHFCVPSLQISPTIDRSLPWVDSKPRLDVGCALNLSSVEKVDRVLSGRSSEGSTGVLYTAGLFYLSALREVDVRPGIAYLNLISAGECLSNAFEFQDWRIFDPETLELLSSIRETLGKKSEKHVRQRMFQVKKRFVATLCDLLTTAVYSGSQAVYEQGRLSAARLEPALKAAYDLRSSYVHTGQDFGNWIRADPSRSDFLLGTPVVVSKELKKILIAAPTFLLLERLIRFALLSYMHRYLAFIDTRLDCASSISGPLGRAVI